MVEIIAQEYIEGKVLIALGRNYQTFDKNFKLFFNRSQIFQKG
jgi:hypothetical protein